MKPIAEKFAEFRKYEKGWPTLYDRKSADTPPPDPVFLDRAEALLTLVLSKLDAAIPTPHVYLCDHDDLDVSWLRDRKSSVSGDNTRHDVVVSINPRESSVSVHGWSIWTDGETKIMELTRTADAAAVVAWLNTELSR